MYKTEGNINFYDLLNNTDSYDNTSKDNTSKDNICLITRQPLDNTKTTLECGHSFNYEHIYNEVIHQKKKQPIMKYIKKHQIQCPYCRAIQDKVLPFLSLKNISPFVIFALLGKSFNILRADNVLPEPDSPTIAVVFPLAISKLIVLTTALF